MVTPRPERPKNALQAHYTTSPAIVRYMVAKLRAGAEDFVWEPSAGKGDLIDGVLAAIPGVHMRASEINSQAVSALQKKYLQRSHLEVHCEDALDLEKCNLFQDELRFTRVVANPPYGGY